MLFRVLIEHVSQLWLTALDALPEWSVEWPFGSVSITVPTWFPIEVLSATLLIAVGVNGLVVSWTVTDWVWRHIPQVMGTGPGAG